MWLKMNLYNFITYNGYILAQLIKNKTNNKWHSQAVAIWRI